MHDKSANDAVRTEASNPHCMTRRSAAKLLGGALLSSLSSSSVLRALPAAQQSAYPTTSPTEDDNAFLDDMQRSACLYFTEQVEPSNGQVLDRAFNKSTTGTRDSRFVSSVAATGFGLTALCIADRRRFISTSQAKKQVLTTLKFHLNSMPHEHGFLYHFNDVETGQPLITAKYLQSTRRSSSAGLSPVAPTSMTRRLPISPHNSTIASNGPGC